MSTPFVEEIRKLLSYDPETGSIKWLENRGIYRCKGKEAGKTTASGYRDIRTGGRTYGAHRIAWLLMTGTWPEHYVDHIDGDKCNNKWANLREATHAQNLMNRGADRDNSIGIKGVSFKRSSSGNDCIRASVGLEGKKAEKFFAIKKLGIMVATREASIWAAEKRAELHGEFANNGV